MSDHKIEEDKTVEDNTNFVPGERPEVSPEEMVREFQSDADLMATIAAMAAEKATTLYLTHDWEGLSDEVASDLHTITKRWIEDRWTPDQIVRTHGRWSDYAEWWEQEGQYDVLKDWPRPDPVETCALCKEPIDYCKGHGEWNNYELWKITDLVPGTRAWFGYPCTVSSISHGPDEFTRVTTTDGNTYVWTTAGVEVAVLIDWADDENEEN